MDSIKELVPYNLKFWRDERKLTQSELAEKANLSVKMIAEVERSNRMPSFPSIERICKALRIDIYQLFLPRIPPESLNSKHVLSKLQKDIIEDIKKHFQKLI